MQNLFDISITNIEWFPNGKQTLSLFFPLVKMIYFLSLLRILWSENTFYEQFDTRTKGQSSNLNKADVFAYSEWLANVLEIRKTKGNINGNSKHNKTFQPRFHRLWKNISHFELKISILRANDSHTSCKIPRSQQFATLTNNG